MAFNFDSRMFAYTELLGILMMHGPVVGLAAAKVWTTLRVSSTLVRLEPMAMNFVDRFPIVCCASMACCRSCVVSPTYEDLRSRVYVWRWSVATNEYEVSCMSFCMEVSCCMASRSWG
eukprot:scaffold498422_cov14-Prasinocladus_malaysianus.AAC.1